MPSFMFAPALEKLLTADTWEKKRKILEEQKDLLLNQDVIDFLDALVRNIDSNTTDDWMAQSAYLLVYRGLLINARVKGIRQAWAEFKMYISSLQQ